MTLLFKKITTAALSLAMVVGVILSVGTTADTRNFETEAIHTGTLRILVNRSNWANDGAIVKFEYGTSLNATNAIGSITGTLVEPDGYVENSAMTIWYAWFEVPSSIIGDDFILRRFNSDSSALWNSSIKYTFTEGLNNQMWYIWDNWSGTVSQGSVDSTNGAFLKHVLEGYMTCSASISNGYLAYPTLLSTYFMNGETPRYSDDLSDDIVSDFALISDYASGTKIVTTNVQYKLDMMKTMYENSL